MENKEKNDTETKKISPISAILSEIEIIKQVGVFPMYNQPITGNRVLFSLKFYSSMIITSAFFVSIWVNIIKNVQNTGEVIETLYFGLTETTFVSKLINMHLRYKTFHQLTKYLSDPEFNDFTQDQQGYVNNGIWYVQMFAKVFRGAVTATIIFFIVFPFLDKSDSMLIIPTWFPESVAQYPYVCYLFQLWGITINGYAHSSLDNVVAGLIMMGSAQFEILKNNLNNLRQDLKVSTDNIENNRQNDYVLNKLSKYVHHHVTIIKFAYEIENLFSVVIFVQFLASSIIICVTGFQIIVTPITDLKFITLVLYFSCNLIQVLMCCWFGHDIMTKSAGVGEACYMSDWYDCDIRVGRTIFIIMERSKRPVTLTAGKFFDLTLQTLMQVLKTSYSYLALLRRMNEVERL